MNASDLRGKSVVITGTLSVPRKDMKRRLEALGARVTSDVSSKTDLVIAGDDPGSKLERARELGIPVLAEADVPSSGAPAERRSVSTDGGPLLLLPVELAPAWSGAVGLDYERALASLADHQQLGGVEVAGGLGVVFPDPFAEAVGSEEGLVLQSTRGADLERRLGEEGDSLWEPTPLALDLPSGRLGLADAADPGSDHGQGVEFVLAPGLYAVDKAFRHGPAEGAELRALRLRPVAQATDVARASRLVALETRGALAARCDELGLGGFGAALANVRDRIVLAVERLPRRTRELPRTRFGSVADLPSAGHWPDEPDLNFAHLCQLDLRELAPFDVGHRLPSVGLLAFFVGTPAVLGGDVQHRVVGRVVYTPPGVETNDYISACGGMAAAAVRFSLAPALPPWTSDLVRGVAPEYADLFDELEQVPVRPTAMFGFDRVHEQELQPNEEMLLSCSSQDAIDYPFCEALTLCFAIDRGALARRDFSGVRCWEGASV